jgi:hypothetical protein
MCGSRGTTSKPNGMYHIDYGRGVFRASVFEALPENQVYDLAAVYLELLGCNQLGGVRSLITLLSEFVALRCRTSTQWDSSGIKTVLQGD